MVLSTKLAGIGHAAFLFMTTARDRVSYIYPNVNAAGAGLFLSETFTAESMNLSEGGYNMYASTRYTLSAHVHNDLIYNQSSSLLFFPLLFSFSEFGFARYHQMVEWLGRPAKKVPRHPVPPLKVSIARRLKEVVEAKYKNAGAEKGKYVVIHGIKCDSQASMQSRGDSDSLLPIEIWAKISRAIRSSLSKLFYPLEHKLWLHQLLSNI